jgi:hypothetical protein
MVHLIDPTDQKYDPVLRGAAARAKGSITLVFQSKTQPEQTN